MRPETRVRALTAYTPEIAAGIGLLLPNLNPTFPPTPISKDHLELLIASPFHDQLVAEQAGKVVGSAALSLVVGTEESNRKAYLEDFVVSSDPHVRDRGVGFALWKSVVSWAQEKDARKLTFTSRASRTAAHEFYLRQGAVIRDTSVFERIIHPQGMISMSHEA